MADVSEFERMTRRVATVPDDEFAGAAVIVPPGDTTPIAFVTSDPNPDLIQFWASVKSRVEIAYTEAMSIAEKNRGGWG